MKNVVMQLLKFVRIELVRFLHGMNFRLVENLISSPVSNARRKGLIQKKWLDGYRSLADPGNKIGQWRHGFDRIKAEFWNRRRMEGIFHKSSSRESPRIGEGQNFPIVEFQNPFPKSRGPIHRINSKIDVMMRFSALYEKSARHSKMEHREGRLIEDPKEEFSLSSNWASEWVSIEWRQTLLYTVCTYAPSSNRAKDSPSL